MYSIYYPYSVYLQYDYESRSKYKSQLFRETEDKFRLELELPGFKKTELKVFTERKILKVEGENRKDRKIKWSYLIPTDFLVTSVSYEDGLLTVFFNRYVPEHEKRKDYSL